jgi:FkbM family methyltransferase
MYNTNIAHAINSNKFLTAGIELYERIKLVVKPRVYKDNHSSEYLPYILNAVAKGYTVLDIGSHKKPYLFDLFKISKLPGRLIAFETNPGISSYLQRITQLARLKNIVIAQWGNTERDHVTGATVIDFKARINKENEEITMNTVDNYCSQNSIVPALIKFKLEGNELKGLRGTRETLKKYKPQILIECAEGKPSRETLLTAFAFLSDLYYSGYFILDTIKVPLASFDFNIYQNEVLGFYCNNFFFE